MMGPGEQEVRGQVLEFILCTFTQLGVAAVRGGGGGGDPFTGCGEAAMREVVAHHRLNCCREEELRAILEHWVGVQEGRWRRGLVKELVEVWRRVERRLPLFPCVMGQKRRSREELRRSGTEGGAAAKRGEAALLLCRQGDQTSRQANQTARVDSELVEVMLGTSDHLDPTGFKAVSGGEGGEGGEGEGSHSMCEHRISGTEVSGAGTGP